MSMSSTAKPRLLAMEISGVVHFRTVLPRSYSSGFSASAPLGHTRWARAHFGGGNRGRLPNRRELRPGAASGEVKTNAIPLRPPACGDDKGRGYHIVRAQ